MKKFDAILRDWYVDKNRIVGVIFDDSKGRFADGSLIRTSKLKKVNFEKDFAVTQNTRYQLEDSLC